MNKSIADAEMLGQDTDIGQEEEKEPLNRSFDSMGSKRGRPLIQDQWTRIIHVSNNTDSWAKVYIIATELLIEGHLPQVSRQTR